MGTRTKYNYFYVYDFKRQLIGEFNREGICKHFNRDIGSLSRFADKDKRINGFYYIRTEPLVPL